jgi:hypothetical protein
MGPPNRPKLLIGWGLRLAIRVKLLIGRVVSFFWCFVGHVHSRRIPHIIHQSTQFGPRMCLLGVSLIYLTPWGVPLKTLHFGDWNGDIQLKRLPVYLVTEGTDHNVLLLNMRISYNIHC